MPKRLVRIQNAGCFHFLTFSCFHRLPLLERGRGYEVFEVQLEKTRLQYRFAVAGYVLMPEHVHLLVSEPQISSLAIAMPGAPGLAFETWVFGSWFSRFAAIQNDSIWTVPSEPVM